MTPLRQRMIEDMQVRNLARHTQRAYLQQISLFARHFDKSPDILGPADIRAYQLHLSQEKRLSPSSILVAVAAIRFLYKVTLGRGWSVDEIIPASRPSVSSTASSTARQKSHTATMARRCAGGRTRNE